MLKFNFLYFKIKLKLFFVEILFIGIVLFFSVKVEIFFKVSDSLVDILLLVIFLLFIKKIFLFVKDNVIKEELVVCVEWDELIICLLIFDNVYGVFVDYFENNKYIFVNIMFLFRVFFVIILIVNCKFIIFL